MNLQEKLNAKKKEVANMATRRTSRKRINNWVSMWPNTTMMDHGACRCRHATLSTATGLSVIRM